jgi:hypothetical protein
VGHIRGDGTDKPVRRKVVMRVTERAGMMMTRMVEEAGVTMTKMTVKMSWVVVVVVVVVVMKARLAVIRMLLWTRILGDVSRVCLVVVDPTVKVAPFRVSGY